MLEIIMCYMMDMIRTKREKIGKWQGLLCPKILKNLEKNKVKSEGCIPTWAKDTKFQISCYLGD